MNEQTRSGVRKTAPETDDDLKWWFFQKDADLGQASIHEVQVAMSLRGARAAGAGSGNANPLVTKGVVRTKTEKEIDRLKGRRLESPAEKLIRVGRCWEQMPAETKRVLELAYGRRHASTLVDAAQEREHHGWGDRLRSKLGRWSNVIVLTPSLIAAHAAAQPVKRASTQRRAPIDRDACQSLPAPRLQRPDGADVAQHVPAWWIPGWAGKLYRRSTASGMPGRICRVSALLRNGEGTPVVVLVTSAGAEVRVAAWDFVTKWEPAPAGTMMPARSDAGCFRVAPRELKTVREWLEDLLSEQHPIRGAKGILETARRESEAMVLAAFNAWCAVRDPGRPHRSTRRYERQYREPFGGEDVR